jgi:hypothetical protein
MLVIAAAPEHFHARLESIKGHDDQRRMPSVGVKMR